MNPRQEFLTTLFAELERQGVGYCVLRNYENLFATTDTDLDLLVTESARLRFERTLGEAATRTGFQLVQTARYVNYSHVYWHRAGGFITIDFETEIRWRQFRVLDADTILNDRVRYQDFFVPAPEHEAVVVLVAALWRNFLSERYRRRLGELFAACPHKADLLRALKGIFGRGGEAVFDFQSRAATAEFDKSFCRRLQWSIVCHTLFSGSRIAATTRNFGTDLGRLWARLRQPAGISLLFASANRRPMDFNELRRRIEVLFPVAKGGCETIDLSPGAGRAESSQPNHTVSPSRTRVLFKGGMFIRYARVASDTNLASAIQAGAQERHPARTFLCAEDSAGQIYLAHAGTGFMAEIQPPTENRESAFAEAGGRFIAETLARQMAQPTFAPRGAFGVLLGLDGAGKTTLARQLCCRLAGASRFTGVRYFHWRPHARHRVELPLPACADQPRKSELPRTAVNSLLSAVRLLKNALLANFAHWWRVRFQVQAGQLVLVDRYYFNYHLDPASVKFSGPPWLLKAMLPLFPQPDFVITLDAPPEVLLSRKRELSEIEIRRQSSVLKNLNFAPATVISADATPPATEVATQTLKGLLKTIA